MLAGVVLGEDEGLSEELRDSFKASGLYHLLAVSGQNVVVLAGAVLGLAWLLGIPRLAAHVAVLVAIAAYVLAVGWQPSVVRAGVAGALASLAWLVSRPRDRWHFLAVGAAVLLAWTPASLLEPGFQLSFAAVGAIFVVVPRMQRWLEGYPVPAAARDVLAVSVACGAATAPILWLQFGQVPVYALLANALVTFAIGPLLALALVGALIEPLLPSVALVLAWVNGWLAEYVATCARLVARLPLAQVGSGKAVCVLLAAPLGLLLLGRLPRARRRAGARLHRRPPSRASRRGSSGRRSICRRRPASAITVLDVGQGDSILVQVPEGAVLVDQGPPEARVAAAAAQPRRPSARRPRPHPSAARPHRRRRAGARAHRRRARARPATPFSEPVRGRRAEDGCPPLGSRRRGPGR